MLNIIILWVPMRIVVCMFTVGDSKLAKQRGGK